MAIVRRWILFGLLVWLALPAAAQDTNQTARTNRVRRPRWTPPVKKRVSTQPNIVFILADD
ncbi:MAG TPA: hypothetical protein VHH73_07030, partial [Verrucomicrobiae bacterium]|nr:hypothetical protein [Verrucomicrobiae bacterium]